jgi:hypothetical protein
MTWSLSELLDGLHQDLQKRLEISRRTLGHTVAKGDASEKVWLELLKTYLPQRYQAERAFVVDSDGVFSEQIDVVVFDRQYSPFIFNYEGQIIIPAESVYAVFESKQAINADEVRYAQDKVATVRNLRRTSLPIPHAGGTYPAKPLIPILGGILTFQSDWSPALGDPLRKALLRGVADRRLDMGCVAAHGYFQYADIAGDYVIAASERAATAFLFDLISRLQFSGTVPMIDIYSYAQWLTK